MLPISPLDLAITLFTLSPDAISLEKIAADLRQNVGDISPTAAAAITPEFMRKIGIIMLNRVLYSDAPIDFTHEMRIWFSILMEDSGVDFNALAAEGLENFKKLPPDEQQGIIEAARKEGISFTPDDF